ncbi:MAG: AMP-binding protein, partial [Bacteroidales bacterium]|nr:AMP-binding protein [Bacteroidales bacterium]
MTFDYSNVSAPWLSSYGDVPAHLDYSEKTMSEAVLDTAAAEGDFPAMTFMGRKIPYSELAENIELAARSFYALGVRPGQRVLVCLPNVPQAIYCLYGLNRIGAVPSMVHPLSAVGEIVHFLNEASCDVAVTLDQFYAKFLDVRAQRPISKLVIARVSEELPFPLNLGQKLMTERKFPKVVEDGGTITWRSLLRLGRVYECSYVFKKDFRKEAVVLFSGGTTGVTKGIMLSDLNFNALAIQTAAMSNKEVNHCRMLAAMPVFHGFGLGVCIHT